MPTIADYLHGVSIQEVNDGAPPIASLSPSTVGIVGSAANADAVKFPLNTPALIRTPGQAVDLGDALPGDTLQSAIADLYAQGATPPIVVVRIEGADLAALKVAAAGNGTTQIGGVYELARAATAVGFTPRILIAPDLSDAPDVITALKTVADNLGGIFYVDADDTVTTTPALAITFADAVNSERGQVLWPHMKDEDGPRPLSPFAAGVRALVDNDPGWWQAASNHALRGISEMNIPLQFSLGQQDEIDDLNERGITTAVAIQGSYRLWGVRSASFADSNRLTPFLIVRRVIDNIGLSLQRGLLWAVDKGITLNLGTALVDGANAYLRTQRDLGAIVKGECWIDEQLVSEVKQGKLYLDVAITPAYPLEHLTIRMRISDEGLIEIFG